MTQESLMSLTNKIAKKSDIGFWAYSSALSFCENCKTLMKGLQSECTHCGKKEMLNGMIESQDMYNK